MTRKNRHVTTGGEAKVATGGGDSAKVGTDQKGKAETGANATPGSELPKTGSISVAPPMVVGASGSETSVTRSGVSAGVIEITDDAAQREKTGKTAEETVASVNRDVSSDKDGANALTNKFDKEQIETSFEIMHAVQRELGAFLNNRVKDYAELKQAREAEKDPTKFAELDRKLEDAKQWAPGGTYRQIATVISAAASGNVSAGMGEFVQRAAVGYLQTLGVEKVKQIADGLNSETARAALQGIVGCADAAASGGNCSAGALGASASVVLNNLINTTTGTNSRDISASDKEARMNLVESIVAGISATDGASAAAASAASRLEMENNQFQLPAGIVSAGAASASLGEFMAKNGATDEEIQQAQTDLLRGLGTDAAQPATELLKSWAALMPGVASVVSLPVVGAVSRIAGAAISGGANVLVQTETNSEKSLSYFDLAIAIAVGAITQGKSISQTASISATGSYMGSLFNKDNPIDSAVATAIGGSTGGVIGNGIAGAIGTISRNKVTPGIGGAVGGSIFGEIITNKINNQKKENAEN